MANKIEYIFSLQDKISAKLGGITATSDKTITALTGVREKSFFRRCGMQRYG